MTTIADTAAEVASGYRYKRYWLLYEVMRCRVQEELGLSGAKKERRQLQRKLVELRKARA